MNELYKFNKKVKIYLDFSFMMPCFCDKYVVSSPLLREHSGRLVLVAPFTFGVI